MRRIIREDVNVNYSILEHLGTKLLNNAQKDPSLPAHSYYFTFKTHTIKISSDVHFSSLTNVCFRTLASRISVLSIRNRHETPEEKKARKLAIKEFKRERRIEKKANTLAFKEEKNRQEKISLNMAKNAQGVKLL